MGNQSHKKRPARSRSLRKNQRRTCPDPQGEHHPRAESIPSTDFLVTVMETKTVLAQMIQDHLEEEGQEEEEKEGEMWERG